MKTSIKILLVVLSLLVIATGFYYFNWQKQQVDYLIPGVPYYGVFNHFFDADSLPATSVADVLGYWGDERFKLADLMKLFSQENGRSTSQLENFFKANGYETYRWTSDETGGEINEIKKFVNSKKKIPVIVAQKRYNEPANIATGYRVVIGVFDGQNKIIAHDHDFGNNYEISYKDFKSLFSKNNRAILAVWPSETLAKEIKGPNLSSSYPDRWPEMKAIGQLLMNGADSVILSRNGNLEKALQSHQKLLDDENFKLFPPAHQVFIYGSNVSMRLKNAKTGTDLDEIIQFINDKILPLNNNLSQPYKNWTEQTGFFKNNGYNEDKFAKPYYLLGLAYERKGDKETAIQNFEKALKINPNQKNTLAELEKLKTQ